MKQFPATLDLPDWCEQRHNERQQRHNQTERREEQDQQQTPQAALDTVVPHATDMTAERLAKEAWQRNTRVLFS